MGTGMLDDLVLTADEPDFDPVAATRYINTILGANGSMDPPGVWVTDPFDSYEIEVDDGDPIEITYAADPGFVIDQFFSNTVEDPAASGQMTNIWSLVSVTEDVVNEVTFVSEDVYDWYDGLAINRGDYTAEHLYLSWLANVHPDADFVIDEVGLDGDFPYVKWYSIGEAHGQVQVLSTKDLTLGWEPTPMAGDYQHVAGTNTWTSTVAADTNRFYRIEIVEP